MYVATATDSYKIVTECTEVVEKHNCCCTTNEIVQDLCIMKTARLGGEMSNNKTLDCVIKQEDDQQPCELITVVKEECIIPSDENQYVNDEIDRFGGDETHDQYKSVTEMIKDKKLTEIKFAESRKTDIPVAKRKQSCALLYSNMDKVTDDDQNHPSFKLSRKGTGITEIRFRLEQNPCERRKLKEQNSSEVVTDVLHATKIKRMQRRKMKDTKCAVTMDQVVNGSDDQDDFNLLTSRTVLPGMHPCESCEKTFKFRSSLTKHRNTHKKIYKCEVCDKSFASKSVLDNHVGNHFGLKTKTAVCNVCDKTFYDQSSLNKHVKTIHMGYKPYACELCDRSFSERKTLTEHTRVHTGERPCTCEICGKTFKRVSELNFHLRKHRGEVKIVCPDCGMSFLRGGQLQTHIRSKHEKEVTVKVNLFRCEICGKGFAGKGLRREHMSTHNLKKFACEKCGKGFYKKSKLKKHEAIKSDCSKRISALNEVNGYLFTENQDGRHVCRYCFMEVDSAIEMEIHRKLLHANEKTFECKICNKSFGRQKGLKKHLKIHQQIRDYQCTLCSMSFIQKHHLDQHTRTHTGEKPYQCNICNKCFAQSATLYGHMKHHKKVCDNSVSVTDI